MVWRVKNGQRLTHLAENRLLVLTRVDQTLHPNGVTDQRRFWGVFGLVLRQCWCMGRARWKGRGLLLDSAGIKVPNQTVSER